MILLRLATLHEDKGFNEDGVGFYTPAHFMEYAQCALLLTVFMQPFLFGFWVWDCFLPNGSIVKHFKHKRHVNTADVAGAEN